MTISGHQVYSFLFERPASFDLGARVPALVTRLTEIQKQSRAITVGNHSTCLSHHTPLTNDAVSFQLSEATCDNGEFTLPRGNSRSVMGLPIAENEHQVHSFSYKN